VAHGMEKARGSEFSSKTIAVLGDSTFIHSGITGLINVIYNKGMSTIVILDNSITGMTGHQDNPTTGYTIKGEKTNSINLEKLCKAIGINRVRIANPFMLKEFEDILKEELAVKETSVIISQSPCVLLKGVKFDGPLNINKDKCKKCKACLAIGCPAIVNMGDYIEVDEALCVGCNLCMELCKFNAFEKAGK
jgi:indolepyruvate ferredoxin oxidoreductase alpha subunit